MPIGHPLQTTSSIHPHYIPSSPLPLLSDQPPQLGSTASSCCALHQEAGSCQARGPGWEDDRWNKNFLRNQNLTCDYSHRLAYVNLSSPATNDNTHTMRIAAKLGIQACLHCIWVPTFCIFQCSPRLNTSKGLVDWLVEPDQELSDQALITHTPQRASPRTPPQKKKLSDTCHITCQGTGGVSVLFSIIDHRYQSLPVPILGLSKCTPAGVKLTNTILR